jgi:hypothetical protein
MPKKFLNVQYANMQTRIDMTTLEDISELRNAIKQEFANTLCGIDAPRLKLWIEEYDLSMLITDLQMVPEVCCQPRGQSLIVRILPEPEHQLHPERALDEERTASRDGIGGNWVFEVALSLSVLAGLWKANMLGYILWFIGAVCRLIFDWLLDW